MRTSTRSPRRSRAPGARRRPPEPVQAQARTLVLTRARLTHGAGEAQIRAAGERLGLDADEARAVAAPALADADVIPAGRALAKLSKEVR